MAGYEDFHFTMRGFRLLKWISACLAAALLVLNVSTGFWSKTEGNITSVSRHLHYYPGGGGRMAVPSYGGYLKWVEGSYFYVVEGKYYQNSLLCICVPFGLKMPNSGERVPVYYVPFSPEIAIVNRDMPVLTLLVLALLSAGFMALENWVKGLLPVREADENVLR